MNSEVILDADQSIADAIDGAEEIPDPLASLAEKTATDPGAPFMPEALEALAALKLDNRAAFEALRSRLKKAGCRVTALDDAIAEESGDAGGRGPTQADILIGLAQTAELFHTADGAGFADLDIKGHRETWTWPSTIECRTSGARSRIAASARSNGARTPTNPTWTNASRFSTSPGTPKGCSPSRNRAKNAGC